MMDNELYCPKCGSYEIDEFINYDTAELLLECLDCEHVWIKDDEEIEEEDNE